MCPKGNTVKNDEAHAESTAIPVSRQAAKEYYESARYVRTFEVVIQLYIIVVSSCNITIPFITPFYTFVYVYFDVTFEVLLPTAGSLHTVPVPPSSGSDRRKTENRP